MTEPAATSEALMPGHLVQVITRRGRIVVGTWIDGWALKSGGVAFKVKPPGYPPVYGTTLEPIKLVAVRAAVEDRPEHPSRLAG